MVGYWDLAWVFILFLVTILPDVFLAPILGFFWGFSYPLPLDLPAVCFLPEPLAPGLPLPISGFLAWSMEYMSTRHTIICSESHSNITSSPQKYHGGNL